MELFHLLNMYFKILKMAIVCVNLYFEFILSVRCCKIINLISYLIPLYPYFKIFQIRLSKIKN